jgi:hypothetical protein
MCQVREVFRLRTAGVGLNGLPASVNDRYRPGPVGSRSESILKFNAVALRADLPFRWESAGIPS